MAKIKSVKFNFIMNFILTATNFIFPLITFPYVSRIIFADGTGKVAFASSIAAYFMMIASLGIPTYGIRACAKVRDDKEKLSKLTQELLILHAITTTITLFVFLIAIFTIEKLEQEKTLMLVNAFSILLNVFGANWLYSALEQYSYITVRSILFKVISIILMFAFVHEKSDYIIYGCITILASVGSNVLNFINLRKHISFQRFQNYEFKKHLKPIMVFFAQSVAISIYTNLDTVMLGFMTNDFEVGYYNAAIKIKNILLSLVTSLGTVLLPRLSYYIQNDFKEEFDNLIKKSFEVVWLISLPLTIYFVIFAKDSLIFLSGESFVGATLAMQLITPTIFFIGLSNITGMQILTPIGKEKYVVVSVIVGAVIDLFANMMFIPLMGSAGASLGTLLAEIGVLFVQIHYLKDMLIGVLNKLEIYKIMLCNIIAMIIVIVVSNLIISSLFIELLFTAIIFFGVYGVLLIILKEPLIYAYVLSIVNKLKQ